MEIQASRSHARVSATGEPILLPDQDRSRWDRLLIRRGLAALARAESLSGDVRGPYTLQAAIAACHARAPSAGETDWRRIVELYSELARAGAVAGRRVESCRRRGHGGRAAAGARAGGPPVDEPSMRRYPFLPGVRGDLLAKLGRLDEARVEFERAASLTRNRRERDLLLARGRKLGP